MLQLLNMSMKYSLPSLIVVLCAAVTFTISACSQVHGTLVSTPTESISFTNYTRQTSVTTSESTSTSQTGIVSYPALDSAIKRDITYVTVDNVSLQLDIYFPKLMSGKTPAVLYVHGGAWMTGDKNIGAGSQDVAALTAAGFIVVPVNYRLAPVFKFPAMIEDVKCAVRFLRAHANEYGIDPDKIGAYGGSAGGHLVSLLGLTDSNAGWDTRPYINYSSQVQAVVDMFGPSDLPALFAPGQQQISLSVFGTSDLKSQTLIRASQISWVNRGDPPFLILQGDKDTTVPLSQSKELYDCLIQGGVEATLKVFKNGTHGLNGSPDMQPTRQDLTQMLVEFFKSYLK